MSIDPTGAFMRSTGLLPSLLLAFIMFTVAIIASSASARLLWGLLLVDDGDASLGLLGLAVRVGDHAHVVAWS